MSDPNKLLTDYYRDYGRSFRAVFPEYNISTGSLWEMPLWVAHMTALLDLASIESDFCDLSQVPPAPEACFELIHSRTRGGDLILMSPLAQNFSLALRVAALLERSGRPVVLGGNMAPLVPDAAVHLVYRGQLDARIVGLLIAQATGEGGVRGKAAREGMGSEPITWIPDYRHLEGYATRIPLLRLNASHGCLYRCSFCGDAWSKQLTLVSPEALAAEVDGLAARFPGTRLIYIGDKTFGQSKEAVRNLLAVFASRPGYRFIVQTHVLQVRPWLIEAMAELGTEVVELGFESGDAQMLKSLDKLSRGLDDYAEKIHMLKEAGFRVVLNVMGGLDEETELSHRQTLRWLEANSDALWLFNLYNFVPYPLIPDFPRLRPRIFNWDYADWREDMPVVYRPAHLSPERSWSLFLEKVEAAHDLIRFGDDDGRA